MISIKNKISLFKMSFVVDWVKNQKTWEDRFETLLPYFEGLLVEDLWEEDPRDIIQLAVPEKRLLMKRFVNSLLASHLDLAPTQHEKYENHKNIRFNKDIGIMTITVIPQQIKDKLPKTDCRSGSGELLTMIGEENKEYVKRLDLRGNHLPSADIKNIGNAVAELPNLVELDLSGNRFSWPIDEEQIFKMLDKPSLNKLAINNNPLASIDGKEFLSKLYQRPNTSYFKLIWVPAEWLESGGWRSMLPPNFDSEPIFKNHQQYYENCYFY